MSYLVGLVGLDLGADAVVGKELVQGILGNRWQEARERNLVNSLMKTLVREHRQPTTNTDQLTIIYTKQLCRSECGLAIVKEEHAEENISDLLPSRHGRRKGLDGLVWRVAEVVCELEQQIQTLRLHTG